MTDQCEPTGVGFVLVQAFEHAAGAVDGNGGFAFQQR